MSGQALHLAAIESGRQARFIQSAHTLMDLAHHSPFLPEVSTAAVLAPISASPHVFNSLQPSPEATASSPKHSLEPAAPSPQLSLGSPALSQLPTPDQSAPSW